MEEKYIRRNRFSERLRAERAKAGLGQVAFAKILGIAQPTLAKYEMCKREPDLDGLMTIAERLNTTPNDLLGFEPPPTSATPSIKTGDIKGNSGAIALGAGSLAITQRGGASSSSSSTSKKKGKRK